MQDKSVAYVNVSCANIYRDATFHCEVDSQAILWERLEIIDKENDFFLVKSEDQYKGWISSYQIILVDALPNYDTVLVMERQVLFYDEPDSDSAIVRDGFAGIHIPVLSNSSGWIETIFPDGTRGWIEKKKTGYINSVSRCEIIKYASSFMGRKNSEWI